MCGSTMCRVRCEGCRCVNINCRQVIGIGTGSDSGATLVLTHWIYGLRSLLSPMYMYGYPQLVVRHSVGARADARAELIGCSTESVDNSCTTDKRPKLMSRFLERKNASTSTGAGILMQPSLHCPEAGRTLICSKARVHFLVHLSRLLAHTANLRGLQTKKSEAHTVSPRRQDFNRIRCLATHKRRLNHFEAS